MIQFFVLTRARIAQVVVLVGAVTGALVGFGMVHWSNAQAGLVATETSTGLVLVMALVVHFRPGVPSEPVAVAGSVTAFVTSSCALLVGFEVVEWTPAQVGLLLGLVATVVTLVGSWSARAVVTSPETLQAAVSSAHRQGMGAAARKMSDGSSLPGAPR